MVTIVRDRIREYVKRGMTLDQVKAAEADARLRSAIRQRTPDSGRPSSSSRRSTARCVGPPTAPAKTAKPSRPRGTGAASERRAVDRCAAGGRSGLALDLAALGPRSLPGRAAAGRPRRPARRRAGRPDRNVGVGRDRGLGVADGHARRRATTRACRSTRGAQASPTRGSRRRTAGARPTASAASCACRAGCESAGRTTPR